MHQGPDVLLGVVEDGWMSDTSREPCLDEVVKQSLLPIEGGVPRAIQAQPETPEIVGMGVRVLRGISTYIQRVHFA